MDVEVHQGHGFVAGFAVEIDQADFLGAALGGDAVVMEVLEAFHGFAGGRFGDDDGALEAGREVVEDAVQGFGVGGRQGIDGGDVVGFDDDVFLTAEGGADLVVYGGQGVVRVA